MRLCWMREREVPRDNTLERTAEDNAARGITSQLTDPDHPTELEQVSKG